ncbi:MAG: alpha-2-macroglobulin family protein, partial [Candidatus Limnocylindrales bacterium]
AVLVPFNVRDDSVAYPGEWWNDYGNADESYWAMLYTDRGVYRQTDRIAVWGYLRGRDDGQVPGKVVVRLVLGGGPEDAAAPIEIVEATPGVDGAFTASVPVSGLPFDRYLVQAVVDGRVVVSRWVEVSVIRKPPYQLDLSPNHTAVIAGSTVTWTTTASFFDGTPVASIDLAMRDDQQDRDWALTTDASGQATLALRAPPSSDPGSSFNQWDVRVHPTGPEGAEIMAYEAVRVFSSAYHLDATGVVDGNRLLVDGSLHEVDLAKAEQQIAEGDGWDADPSGAPVAGRTVTIRVNELIPVRRQVGSSYDYVNKVVRPIYEYDYDREPVRTVPVKSRANGGLALSIAIPNADHQYEVVLSARDLAGRLQERTIWVRRDASSVSSEGVEFVTLDGGYAGEAEYGVGEKVTWRMVNNGQGLPSGGSDRYLYVVAQRGLRSAAVTDQATFQHTFAAADAPGVFVMGVRFTGTNYAPKAAAWASFESTERAISVRVTADREGYRPGETARLSVRTTGPDGSPVSATVVIQAVDQKLYAMGDAEVPDPIADLYERVASGIIRLTATHQVPTMSGPEGEGGDTTGSGPRSDFKDTLLFRELRTGADGRSTTTLRLSDDLTSWHVTASAVTSDLRAGVGELMVPVGLPFFVELTLADTYVRSDRPAIQVRAFGEALRAGDPVDFSVASPSLGLAEQRVHGTAFEPVTVELPALVIGTQSITASAVALSRADGAGKPLTDALTRTFDVVASRLTAGKVAYRVVTEGLPEVPAGADRSFWTFTDAGRGNLVPVLSSLAERGSLRLDRSIAQSMANEALVKAFGRDPASLPPLDFDSSLYPLDTRPDADSQTIDAGVGLLPYGDPDPWLAARVALFAADVFPAASLREALTSIRDLPVTRRDLQIAAIAGLAGLGEPVLDQLEQARRQPDLTPTELIYLALGFEASGDDASALAIERDLLNGHGEALGTWIRLNATGTESSGDPTALLAVVASGLGDPLATGLADYASSNPAPDTVNALELAAYATRSLERMPVAAASFAYAIDGRRSVVALEPGEAFTLSLTAEQARSLAVETTSGRVMAIVEARVPVAPSSLRPHPDLALTRTIPTGPLPTDRLVEVNLTATFAPGAPTGCYDVTEFVPSGLAPLTGGQGGTDDRGITWPSSVVGQEVRFCVYNSADTGRTARLRYLARVVNEGTFSWEPAIMQLPSAPELLAISSSGTATIGTP